MSDSRDAWRDKQEEEREEEEEEADDNVRSSLGTLKWYINVQ